MDEYQKLLIEAEELDDGPGKVALAERAVRVADTQQHFQRQFESRQYLIDAAFSGGIPDRLFVAISWCLAMLDKQEEPPDWLDRDRLLWQCKLAISWMSAYHEVAVSQYDTLVEDSIARYEQHGASPRSVYQVAMIGQFFMGRRDVGERYHDLANQSAYDMFADTRAWEAYFEAEYLFATGQDAAGLKLLEPWLRNPRAAADAYPYFARKALLLLLRERRAGEALHHQRLACQQMGMNPRFLAHAAYHIMFLTLRRDFAGAIRMLGRHLPLAMASSNPASRMYMWCGASLALRLTQRCGASSGLRLVLPDAVRAQLSADDGDDPYTQAVAWFERELAVVVEKFNQRNGNQHVTGLIEKIRAYEELMLDRPLT
ncbi:MAG: hypothetical protein AB7K09_02630 [Planctomycetota bacterium]